MENLRIFEHSEFGKVRTLVIKNEPWFVGKDVSDIIGYSRSDNAIRKYVDDEDKLMHQIDASGQSRNMTLINESGLYSLTMSSKLQSAKKFKRWVTSEVLPSIRKFGGYLTPKKLEEALLSPDTMIKLVTNLKNEMEKNKKLEHQVVHLEHTKAQISRKREATVMSRLAHLTNKINKMTDTVKRNGEYTDKEVAVKVGIYSKNGNPHSQLVSSFSRLLNNKKPYLRVVKVALPNGKYVDCTYHNNLFVEKFTEYINKIESDRLCLNGVNYKFYKLLYN